MIKETIVVEGKNDAAAVRRAVEADIIITSGFGINRQILERISTAQRKNGVIVLTDPDFMGEKIRKIISDRIKGVKHAFIPREDAREAGDIGVENAAPESILKALSMAKCELAEVQETFTRKDMVCYELTGTDNAAARRNKLGALLGIGYGNTKQFLSRLNKYGIGRDELETALEKINNNTEDDGYEG